MLYATIHNEKTLTELVHRLYQLPGANRLASALACDRAEVAALLRKAEEALSRANPALGDFAQVPPGMILVVPLVEGLKPTSAVRGAGTPVQDTLAAIDRAVTSSLATLQSSAKQELKNLTELQRTLESGHDDWKQLLGEFKTLQEALPAIRARINREIDSLKQMIELQPRLKKQLAQDLKEFVAQGS